ncbi:unnamed protein product, partial [Polarella glacialis]
VMPLTTLQEKCRERASHVVAATPPRDGQALSHEELVEAMVVATWGGATRGQQVSKSCKEKGVPLDRLESLERAEQLLAEFNRLEACSTSDLIREFKSRGFATALDVTKEKLVELLKESLLWESLQLSELRLICKQQGLNMKGEHRRADLLKLLSAESWKAFGIPVLKLPDLITAHGILDQVQRFEKKELQELRAECRRRQLPVEAKPSKQDLVSRLRDVLVWQHMAEADLELECSARTKKTESNIQEAKAGKLTKAEMTKVLKRSVAVAMFERRGIPVTRIGQELAEELFRE